jgi:ATP-binding cassette subfamily F protein uup
VERLSGGERARVLIAKLMLEPADLLLLDEPTNDLDIATLEILEESLLEYTGALVLVTHDRYMLDRVSTVVLGLDGLGNARHVRRLLAVGAVAARARARRTAMAARARSNPVASRQPRRRARRSSPTWKPRVRVDRGPGGGRRGALNAARDLLDEPSVATNADALTAALHEMEQAQAAADELYARWAELTEKG